MYGTTQNWLNKIINIMKNDNVRNKMKNWDWGSILMGIGSILILIGTFPWKYI